MYYKKVSQISVVLISLIVFLSGCGFDDPYVPDSVGSSSLSGRISTRPSIDVSNAEVILRGQDSISTISDINGNFKIDDIIPGDYFVEIQKSPYIQTSFLVNIEKDIDDNLGEIKVDLQGAISLTIPLNKIGIIYGEFEIVVYVNGVPRVPIRNSQGEFVIDLTPDGNDINIRTVTKTIVYIDNKPYYAKVLEDGEIFVEFVPPGIYTNINVKLSTDNGTLPISSVPVEIKSGEIRSISLES